MKIIYPLVVMLSSLLMLGCQNVKPELDKDMEKMEAPREKSTDYNEALLGLGNLMTVYTGRSLQAFPLRVQTKDILDETGAGGLPSDISTMIDSALVKVGEPIVVVEHDYNYISNEMAVGGGGIERQLPELLVSGAITEFDRKIDSESGGTNFSLGVNLGKSDMDLDSSKDNSKSVSRLTLDLKMLNYSNQTATGALTSNTINIRKQSKSNDIGFFIFGAGVGMNGAVSKSEGIHAAIRKLVEFSVIQLIGRDQNLPYWRLFEGVDPDKFVVARVKRDIRSSSLQENIEYIINSYEHSVSEESEYIGVLNRISSDYGLSMNIKNVGQVTEDVIMKYFLNIPLTSKFAMNSTLGAYKKIQQYQLDKVEEQSALEQQYDSNGGGNQETEVVQKQPIYQVVNEADKEVALRKIESQERIRMRELALEEKVLEKKAAPAVVVSSQSFSKSIVSKRVNSDERDGFSSFKIIHDLGEGNLGRLVQYMNKRFGISVVVDNDVLVVNSNTTKAVLKTKIATSINKLDIDARVRMGSGNLINIKKAGKFNRW